MGTLIDVISGALGESSSDRDEDCHERKESQLQAQEEQINFLFVLGPPGAGKGTQCAIITQKFKSIKHFSVGDLLRAAQKDKNNPNSKIINQCISQGSIVPIDITMKLIEDACVGAMNKEKETEKEKGKNISLILLDGFPRNADNLNGWNKYTKSKTNINLKGVLFLSLGTDQQKTQIVKQRILNRNESRIDDNEKTMIKRMKTYENETMQIIQSFKEKNQLFVVDATQSIDNVTLQVTRVIQQLI